MSVVEDYDCPNAGARERFGIIEGLQAFGR